MKLYYIDEGTPRAMPQIEKGIAAVYQLKEEFHPYLEIVFLPYREGQQQGIILQTKTDSIKKNYTFNTQKDIDDLRQIIWFYLLKENKGFKTTGNGDDSIQFNITSTWKEKMAQQNKKYCCKIMLPNIQNKIDNYNVVDEIYRLSPNNNQTIGICKKVRYKICDNNYPFGTFTNNICRSEVTKLCETNNNIQNNYIKNYKKDLFNKLEDNDFKVNKRDLDNIVMAGMFVDSGFREGNKSNNIVKWPNGKNFTANDYYRSLEGFGNNNNNWIFFILVILFIFILVQLF
jgi:hypothetical protein